MVTPMSTKVNRTIKARRPFDTMSAFQKERNFSAELRFSPQRRLDFRNKIRVPNGQDLQNNYA